MSAGPACRWDAPPNPARASDARARRAVVVVVVVALGGLVVVVTYILRDGFNLCVPPSIKSRGGGGCEGGGSAVAVQRLERSAIWSRRPRLPLGAGKRSDDVAADGGPGGCTTAQHQRLMWRTTVSGNPGPEYVDEAKSWIVP